MNEIKLQYIVRPAELVPGDRFRERVLELLVPELLARAPRRLTLHLSLDPPQLSVIPLRRRPLALVSIWQESGPTGDWFLPLSRLGRVSG